MEPRRCKPPNALRDRKHWRDTDGAGVLSFCRLVVGAAVTSRQLLAPVRALIAALIACALSAMPLDAQQCAEHSAKPALVSETAFATNPVRSTDAVATIAIPRLARPPMHHQTMTGGHHANGRQPVTEPLAAAQATVGSADCCTAPDGKTPSCPSCPAGMGCAGTAPPAVVAPVVATPMPDIIATSLPRSGSTPPAEWSRPLDTPPPKD